MFKSIFAKNLTISTIILLVCIVALLLTVTSVVSDDNVTTEYRAVQNLSAGFATIIENSHNDGEFKTLAEAFGKDGPVTQILSDTDALSDIEVYIFSGEGNLLGTSEPQGSDHGTSVPRSVINGCVRGETYYVSTLEGFFKENRLCGYSIGIAGEERFIVFAGIKEFQNSIFKSDMVVSVITVSLWIFFGSMIIIYLYSLRTTRPLTNIVNEAKNYAKGDFSKRIKVSGHDEVAELAEAINEMADSLSDISRERKAFLGNVSHDLRTPMTTIGGFVDGILDGTIPPEKHEYYLKIISDEVRRLSRLVNTLLEISRSESTELNRAEFNLSELARTVIIMLEKKINSKNLDFEFLAPDDDVFVTADADSIHRVLFNLVDNAIKFTPDGEKITVSVDALTDKKKKQRALIKVRNRGVGITEEEKNRIFERFYKIDSSRGLDKTGTGLGLYIAKSNVAAHGEELTVDSDGKTYTEFAFSLPTVQINPQKPKL